MAGGFTRRALIAAVGVTTVTGLLATDRHKRWNVFRGHRPEAWLGAGIAARLPTGAFAAPRGGSLLLFRLVGGFLVLLVERGDNGLGGRRVLADAAAGLSQQGQGTLLGVKLQHTHTKANPKSVRLSVSREHK